MTLLPMLLAQEADAGTGLTTAGALMMCLSVGLVLTLNIFCMARILTGHRDEPR